MHLLDRAWDDEFLDGFLALETWGNDNVCFPGECYRRYVEELYRGDALARGELHALGPARAARGDHLPDARGHVRARQHRALGERGGARRSASASTDKQRLHLPGGHVGAVVSQKASRTLWPDLAAWWAARDAGPASLHEGGSAAEAGASTRGRGAKKSVAAR